MPPADPHHPLTPPQAGSGPAKGWGGVGTTGAARNPTQAAGLGSRTPEEFNMGRIRKNGPCLRTPGRVAYARGSRRLPRALGGFRTAAVRGAFQGPHRPGARHTAPGGPGSHAWRRKHRAPRAPRSQRARRVDRRGPSRGRARLRHVQSQSTEPGQSIPLSCFRTG